MIAVFFPGQGSQKVSMGGFLIEHYEDLLGDLLQESKEFFSLDFKELFLRGTELDLQKWAQPGLFLIGALWNKVLEHRGFPLSSWASCGAGHSLGEYSALYNGGVITFSQGLRLIKKRLECLEKAPPGSMGAVLGLPRSVVEKILELWELPQCFVANDNSDEQVVISGKGESMDMMSYFMEPLIKNWNIHALYDYEVFSKFPLNVQEKIQTKAYEEGFALGKEYRKIKYVPLKVGGPFHCNLMTSCNEEFLEFLDKESFQSPMFPIIPNTGHGCPMNNAQDLKNALRHHMVSPVGWRETMNFIIEHDMRGVVEIGPGQVLTNLLKRTAYKGWTLNLDNGDSLGTLEKYLKP